MFTERTAHNLLSLIGNTPLLQLDLETKATVYAKLEFLNPGGSIKDRAALFMIEQAEKESLLKKGSFIIEPSSGNQGIAIAMISAIKGYKAIITVPERTSIEKIRALKAYGATVHICPNTDNLDDPRGYHALAVKLHKSIPNSFMPSQYTNPTNSAAHYNTTGPEIWKQTCGLITHFVAGMGSCGTITGVARYLKEQKKTTNIIGIDAATSALSSRNPKSYETEGIGVDHPNDGNYDASMVDTVIPVQDVDAFAMTRTLFKKGLLVGLSSGAVAWGTQSLLPTLHASDVVVCIFADSGRAYLSKLFPTDDIVKPISTSDMTARPLQHQQ